MHAFAIFLSPKNSQPAALSVTTSLPKAKPANPAICMWENKGGLGKSRGGRSHGRRRSLDLSPKTSQQTPLQPPLPQEENLATSYMYIL
jgi:hypothetical protein